MRKDKTYEQQKKYYDESGDFESLGAIFVYWLECGQRDRRTDAGDIQRRQQRVQKFHTGRLVPPM